MLYFWRNLKNTLPMPSRMHLASCQEFCYYTPICTLTDLDLDLRIMTLWVAFQTCKTHVFQINVFFWCSLFCILREKHVKMIMGTLAIFHPFQNLVTSRIEHDINKFKPPTKSYQKFDIFEGTFWAHVWRQVSWTNMFKSHVRQGAQYWGPQNQEWETQWCLWSRSFCLALATFFGGKRICFLLGIGGDWWPGCPKGGNFHWTGRLRTKPYFEKELFWGASVQPTEHPSIRSFRWPSPKIGTLLSQMFQFLIVFGRDTFQISWGAPRWIHLVVNTGGSLTKTLHRLYIII